jgi:hypothetical protein
MNSQTNPHTYPDARIDHVLTALRTTDPPAGLEARIAARLVQARSQSVAAPSFFANLLRALKAPSLSVAPQNLYLPAASALTLLLAITTLSLLHNRTTSPSQPISYQSIAPTPSLATQQASASTTTPEGSLTTHTSPTIQLPPSAPDPDQIALAETLAPSRPAPPMPLTVQEQVMVAATRPGQPLQLAELDLARAPILQAILEAREAARINRYVRQSLAPLAVADALSPTTDSQPQDAATPPPAPPPSQN